jgi:hypothetical protein
VAQALPPHPALFLGMTPARAADPRFSTQLILGICLFPHFLFSIFYFLATLR